MAEEEAVSELRRSARDACRVANHTSYTLLYYRLEDAIRNKFGSNAFIDGFLKYVESFEDWMGVISKSTDPSWSALRSVVRVREELATALSTVLAKNLGSSLSSSVLQNCYFADKRTRDCIQRSGLSEYWDQRIDIELPIALASVFHWLRYCANANSMAMNRPKTFMALKIMFRKWLKHDRVKKELEQAHGRLESLLGRFNQEKLPPGLQAEGMKENITTALNMSAEMIGTMQAQKDWATQSSSTRKTLRTRIRKMKNPKELPRANSRSRTKRFLRTRFRR
jgi:hypothetical protein